MKITTREVANCGTYGGYQTHQRINEPPCDPCIKARNQYMKEYRRRKGHTTSTLVKLEDSCPNCGHGITA